MNVTVSVACLALAAGTTFPGAVEVKLKGYLGERLDAMIERHVVATDVDYITAPFREKTERRKWWQTEFWGKYMHSAPVYQAYCGSERLCAAIDRGVDVILASQEPCGYIGNYPDDLRCGEGWDVWGMKYTMMGLMHYADWKGGERGKAALAACRRLCDYLIGELGPNGRRGRAVWQTGNWSGYASSSVLEPVMWLYRRTGEKRYLDFAAFVVKGMEEPADGPRLVDLALKGVSVADRDGDASALPKESGYVIKRRRFKAYEMMSCYQGLLEFYEATGRKDLFEAALKTAEDIVREEINLAGGCACAEVWFHGAGKQHLPYYRLQETCVLTTWMRLCAKLLELTDDPRWADQLERTFYNAYLASMKADGSAFAAYTPLTGYRGLGHDHCYMHTDCCTANGPRGFLCFLREFYRRTADAATFNFYASALVDGFDMYSRYPRLDEVRIVSHTEGRLKLRMRIPAWSAKTVVKLNGKELPDVAAGRYFIIDRIWQLGDVVEIRFDMPTVVHVNGTHVAFTRGPVLLARDSRFGDDFIDDVLLYRFRDGDRIAAFAPIASPDPSIWMAFTAKLPFGCHGENPEGRQGVAASFCDYASAGNQWRRANHYRTWFDAELRNDE